MCENVKLCLFIVWLLLLVCNDSVMKVDLYVV